MATEKELTQEQIMAITLAIDCMERNYKRNWNRSIVNRDMHISVGFGQAINILENMILVKQ